MNAENIPSPTETDPDKYKVIFENDKVRVFNYKDKPGDRTSLHHHEEFVLYALSPFKRKITFADGKSSIREFQGGEVIWGSKQDHIGENIGSTDTDVLIVEFKTSK